MLSNSAKYAMKAVLYLALHSNGTKRIMIKDMHEKINVPRSYLAKLLQELSRHGLVSSTRGPKGGFYLTTENRDINLIDIINVIDGDYRLNTCILSLHKCDTKHPCPLHNVVGDTQGELLQKFKETKVQDLVADIKKGKSFLSV